MRKIILRKKYDFIIKYTEYKKEIHGGNELIYKDVVHLTGDCKELDMYDRTIVMLKREYKRRLIE